MSMEVIQPQFDASEIRFLSNNQELIKALDKQVDDAIRLRQRHFEYAVRHPLNFSETGIHILTDGIHEQHAMVLIIRALGHLFSQKGYTIDDTTNSAIVLNWREGKDKSPAALSRLRTLAWRDLYAQMSDIKNDVLSAALLNVVNDELTVGVSYQKILGQNEQASFIKEMLFGYKQKGFHVFDIEKKDHHEITISW